MAEAPRKGEEELLANVSHEILTPMNAILGMTELVLDSTLAEEQRRLLLTVRSAARDLLEILNDLLDVSQLHAGKLALDLAPFGLRASLDEIIRALEERARRKGLGLVYRVDPGVPESLLGDAGRIRQIVLNIVGNAVKFTSQGEVDVRIDLDAALTIDRIVLRLTVADTGIGIDEAMRTAIFRAFEQEDMSTTRRHGGAGLGLTIASRLATLMDGSVELESEVGKGSTFTCTFVVSPGPASGHILVVEDNELNAELVEQLLRRRGYEVTLATGGRQAIELLAARRFDALLLDLHMPEVDGFQVVRELRAREASTGEHLPVIALTALSRPSDRDRCLAAGMDEFVSKPVEAIALWRLLERFVAR